MPLNKDMVSRLTAIFAPIDAVVLTIGAKPDPEEIFTMAFRFTKSTMLSVMQKPGNMMDAIRQGHKVARTI